MERTANYQVDHKENDKILSNGLRLFELQAHGLKLPSRPP